MQTFNRICVFIAVVLLIRGVPRSAIAADDSAKSPPKIAIFPLGGKSEQKSRDQLGAGLHAKLNRQGTFEAIEILDMQDMAAPAKEPITADTGADVIKDLASDSGASVLVWGDVSPGDGGELLRLKILDLRVKNAAAQSFQFTFKDLNERRTAEEKALESIAGVEKFARPNEVAVRHDAESDAAFAKNPNLVVNGDFTQAGHWNGIYLSEYYPVALSDATPEVDKVCIYRMPEIDGEKAANVLAMNLSKNCAENNGMACLSDAIAIEPGVRYRLTFRYRSDGPTLHVFVKGYTSGKNLAGETADREIYRRQVPPSGSTDGKWVTVEDELNPQHVHFPVQTLKIDLYAYFQPGSVMFSDVVLKAVGKQRPEDIGKDEAIKAPTTRQLGEEK